MPRADRRHAPPEARRAQILDAAFRCFAEKGYHAARMDDLVAASGLSKGSLYWHFKSKEDVFLALYDTLEQGVFAAWDDEAAHTAGTLDLLRREGEIVLDRMADQRHLVRAWMEFFAHPAARERMALTYRRTRARLGDLVRRGIDRGEIRPDVPVEEVAASFTANVEGLVLQTFVDSAFDARRSWDRTWSVFARGLAR